MASLLAALKAQPDVPPVTTDPAQIDRRYRYWRFRILAGLLIGYAIYYFVRTNIPVAVKTMQKDLGYSKAQLGAVMSVGGVVYGVSKFINGFLGDRANPRYFMAAGLLLCAAFNVLFGKSSTLAALMAFWFFNNWAQGMGFPPCARGMGYWFSPRERSTTFGIWHMSHTSGAALVAVLCGFIIDRTGNWRLCFYVPAGIAVVGALMLAITLRDTPGSMGLPPVEVYKGEESLASLARETLEDEPYLRVVWENVLKSPFMWVISIANLLVYILRSTSVSWGPTYLQEMKQMSSLTSSSLLAASEFAGMGSALLAGYCADRFFRGRAGRACVIAMAAMALILWLFVVTPPSMKWLAGTCYIAMAFMVYVPQMLIAAMAMNLATKRAAAVAVGLTGIIGYLSNIVSGWGIGAIADRHDWNGAFKLMIGCAVATAALMALTWNVGAHPQLAKTPEAATAEPQVAA